jgi:hypothetical protein
MSSGILHHVALVRIGVSENISPPSSGSFGVIGVHSCVTVESLFISLSLQGYYVGPKNAVFWDVFTAVLMKDAFWDLVLYDSS